MHERLLSDIDCHLAVSCCATKVSDQPAVSTSAWMEEAWFSVMRVTSY